MFISFDINNVNKKTKGVRNYAMLTMRNWSADIFSVGLTYNE